MKKSHLVAITILLALLIAYNNIYPGSQVQSFTNSNTDVIHTNQFAFDLFQQLNSEDGNENLLISPYSIITALTMAYQGANGTTKESMATALRYPNPDSEIINQYYKSLNNHLKGLDNSVELNINNSIWIREGEKVNNDFLKVNQDIFNAHVEKLDFAQSNSPDIINKWINESTKGKIPKMINGPIPPDAIMYLINAIYFKGEWTDEFDKNKTFTTQFNAGDGSIQTIEMMSRSGKVDYGQGDQYQVVRLPYGDGKISMYNILPAKEVKINDFIGTLTADKWEQIKSSISPNDDVLIQIPRFTMEYGVKDLKGSLTNMGMGNAFDRKADFSGIRDDVYINGVQHKALLEVNEGGSEAAAVTVVEFFTTSFRIHSTIFNADRPFVFLIVDDETDTILFMGKLYSVL